MKGCCAPVRFCFTHSAGSSSSSRLGGGRDVYEMGSKTSPPSLSRRLQSLMLLREAQQSLVLHTRLALRRISVRLLSRQAAAEAAAPLLCSLLQFDVPYSNDLTSNAVRGSCCSC